MIVPLFFVPSRVCLPAGCVMSHAFVRRVGHPFCSGCASVQTCSQSVQTCRASAETGRASAVFRPCAVLLCAGAWKKCRRLRLLCRKPPAMDGWSVVCIVVRSRISCRASLRGFLCRNVFRCCPGLQDWSISPPCLCLCCSIRLSCSFLCRKGSRA